MPGTHEIGSPEGLSILQIHALIKATGLPNYMQARIPIQSQLNVQVWKDLLNDYCDQQLLQLIEFGFPLGFNRNCPLRKG